MTKVFIADVSKLNSDISLYKDCVSQYRYEKAMKYKRVGSRLLSIGGELLLAEYLGRKPCYKVDEYGKPYGEETEFNLSHSGNIAVCAVSDSPVGVDVEKMRSINMDIAKRKFCVNEYNTIMNSENPQECFFEYWVKKESYVKAVGKGLRIPLNEVYTDKISDWQFYMYDINGYKLCVCSKEKTEYVKNLFVYKNMF